MYRITVAREMHHPSPVVDRPLSTSGRGRLPKACRQILEYLAENPSAGDTADGIVQWWLIERQLIEARRAVESALQLLVERDWVTTTTARDSRLHYRLNQHKTREIHQFLKGREST
jgi:hypothetical protein